jgi:hypothetical protein
MCCCAVAIGSCCCICICAFVSSVACLRFLLDIHLDLIFCVNIKCMMCDWCWNACAHVAVHTQLILSWPFACSCSCTCTLSRNTRAVHVHVVPPSSIAIWIPIQVDTYKYSCEVEA